MYPQIELPFGITVYTFGIALSISFLLFFGMLYKLSGKFGINTNFFIGNALQLFLASFVLSRLFFHLSEFKDVISEGFLRFFVTSDYNFSLAGGALGFFLVLIHKLKKHKLPLGKYLDAVVLAFLFAGVIGYLGAFIGGQIYGKPTNLPFGITYSDPESANPYTSPVVPLALIYAFFCFVYFVVLYIARAAFVKIDGLVGYLGLSAFAPVLLIGEFWNGAEDSFKGIFFLNLTQIMAVVCMLFAFR